LLAPLDRSVIGLSQSTDSLFVIDGNGGADTGNVILPKTGVILKVPKAGGAPVPIYTPTPPRRVTAANADGADLFFLEYDVNTADAKPATLSKMPAAGGAPASVTTTTFDIVSTIDAITATDLLVNAPTTAGNFGLHRIARAGGTPVLIADVPSTKLASVSILGDDVFFAGAQGAGKVYKTSLSAAAPSQSEVKDTSPCAGGFTLVAGGLYCGGLLELTKMDRAFVKQATIYSALSTPEDKEGSAPSVYGIDGANIFFGANTGSENRVTIRTFAEGTTAHRALACDVASVRSAVVDASAVYFIESRAEGSGASALFLKKVGR